jgi:hypothetical protein
MSETKDLLNALHTLDKRRANREYLTVVDDDHGAFLVTTEKFVQFETQIGLTASPIRDNPPEGRVIMSSLAKFTRDRVKEYPEDIKITPLAHKVWTHVKHFVSTAGEDDEPICELMVQVDTKAPGVDEKLTDVKFNSNIEALYVHKGEKGFYEVPASLFDAVLDASVSWGINDKTCSKPGLAGGYLTEYQTGVELVFADEHRVIRFDLGTAAHPLGGDTFLSSQSIHAVRGLLKVYPVDTVQIRAFNAYDCVIVGLDKKRQILFYVYSSMDSESPLLSGERLRDIAPTVESHQGTAEKTIPFIRDTKIRVRDVDEEGNKVLAFLTPQLGDRLIGDDYLKALCGVMTKTRSSEFRVKRDTNRESPVVITSIPSTRKGKRPALSWTVAIAPCRPR